MVPGRCLPADLWLLRGATTCTMFTSSVISWCDNSPTGFGTRCGCDAWNLVHVYLAKNRGRCCKSAHSFSHSELGPHKEFTCTTRSLRSNLRTVGTSRWREHFASQHKSFLPHAVYILHNHGRFSSGQCGQRQSHEDKM